jgi:TatA/E family protein of Tat protein translocase
MGRIEEILLILAVGLLFFGPNKMVDFAKGLGTAMREFKKAANPDDPANHTVSTPAPATPAQAALPAEVAKPAETKEHSTVS